MPDLPNDGSGGGGVLAGAAGGALAGSVVPGIGTAIGAGVGALRAWLANRAANSAARREENMGVANQYSDYNRTLADAYNFDPNFAARNMMQAQWMAGLLNNPNMQGESSADRNPQLARLLATLSNPNNQGMYESGNEFAFRPADFKPASLDRKGNIINNEILQPGNAPSGGYQPPPIPEWAKPKPQIPRPEDQERPYG